MAPARPRVNDDNRSETSTINTIPKERVNHNQYTKRKALNALANGTSSTKPAPIIPRPTAPAEPVEPPHVDWTALSQDTLYSYRSAYQLQIPSSYKNPHADILYRSSSIARKAPSQCLARRKNHDLKQYRNRIASESNSRRRNKKIRAEEPPSPTSHPSLPDSDGRSPSSDDTPSIYLNPNPEDTIIGRSSTTSLANSIRSHFNAQQVQEAETLARFAYVLRQQGSNIQPKTQRIISGMLPNTTAENIAAVADVANTPATVEAAAASNGKAPAKVAQPPASRSIMKVMSGNEIEVEGSYGDGKGWTMSTTSHGRQVRTGEGDGAFRLRFRP